MREYVTDAIVLAEDHSGESDSRYFLLTQKYGKCAAKGKSTRKITSRLAAHLQPGTLARVRIVENRDMHVVDALRVRSVAAPVPALSLICDLLPEWDADENIWESLLRDDFSWESALRALGWDPSHAVCGWCATGRARAFHIASQEYVCASCALSTRSAKNDMIFL